MNWLWYPEAARGRRPAGNTQIWKYNTLHRVPNTKGLGQWGHEVGTNAFQYQLCCSLLLVLRWASLEVRV